MLRRQSWDTEAVATGMAEVNTGSDRGVAPLAGIKPLRFGREDSHPSTEGDVEIKQVILASIFRFVGETQANGVVDGGKVRSNEYGLAHRCERKIGNDFSAA